MGKCYYLQSHLYISNHCIYSNICVHVDLVCEFNKINVLLKFSILGITKIMRE